MQVSPITRSQADSLQWVTRTLPGSEGFPKIFFEYFSKYSFNICFECLLAILWTGERVWPKLCYYLFSGGLVHMPWGSSKGLGIKSLNM